MLEQNDDGTNARTLLFRQPFPVFGAGEAPIERKRAKSVIFGMPPRKPAGAAVAAEPAMIREF